jgi:hypothetical protein
VVGSVVGSVASVVGSVAGSVASVTGSVVSGMLDSAMEYLCSIGGHGNGPVKNMEILDINGNNSGAYGTYVSLASMVIGLFALADFYVHAPQGYNMQVASRDKSWFDRAKLREFRKNRSEKAGESK